MAQHSLGIDIKEDGIAIAYLKKSFRNVRLAAHALYSLEKDMQLRKKLEIVRERLREFMRENRISSVPVFIGIPGELTIFKDIEFPSVVKENLRSTLRYEMEKHVPLPAEDVHFDCQILSESKNRLKVLLTVAKKSAVTPYLDFSGTLGGKIFCIEPCPTALINFLAYKSGKNSLFSETDILRHLKTKPAESDFPAELSGSMPSPELIPAFGLGLRGLWDTPVKINLLPAELRKKPGRAGYYLMLALIAATVLSGLAWGGSHILQQKLALKNLDTEMARLRTELADMDRTRENVEKLEEEADYLNTLGNGRPSASEILRELSQLVPETVWIRELTVSGNEVQMDGYAASASELIPLLEASPLFKDVVFLATITKDKEGKERFRIGMKMN